MNFRHYEYNLIFRPDARRHPGLDHFAAWGSDCADASNRPNQHTSLLMAEKGSDHGSFVPRPHRLAARRGIGARCIPTDCVLPIVGTIWIEQSNAPGSGFGREQHCGRPWAE